MIRPIRLVAACAAAVLTVVGSAQAVTIATVPVGYAGNSPDPASGTRYGAVPYNYSIGIYDVTNAQYVEFLNAKASAADPFGLWNPNMDPSSFEGAISRSGSGPYGYAVKPGFANKPVIYVSWYDAVRFVNWLQNGQGSGDTESGTYLIANGGTNSGTVIVPNTATRTNWANSNSFHWVLPSDNEWYKAAYFNAPAGTYYFYPFQTNSEPTILAPPGDSNSGNFLNVAYNYDGSGSYLTDVGAYPNSISPFGSFDMGGDVFQWNDTAIELSRGLRGVDWSYYPYVCSVLYQSGSDPTSESYRYGFRVGSIGSVPEPSTALLAVLACGMICCCWTTASYRIARRGVLRNDATV